MIFWVVGIKQLDNEQSPWQFFGATENKEKAQEICITLSNEKFPVPTATGIFPYEFDDFRTLLEPTFAAHLGKEIKSQPIKPKE